MRQPFADAQAGYGFVVSQTSHIEAQVYRTKYTQIQYPDLVPIDTSANDWVKSVTYYSADQFGAARWLNLNAGDFPYGSEERTKYETAVWEAGRGYRYGLAEVNQAAMLGENLDVERARGARRAYEEFVDTLALFGDVPKAQFGIFNNPYVPIVAAPNGQSGSPLWPSKTPGEIIADLNNTITGVQVQTNNVINADTLLLPYARYNYIASTQMPNVQQTVLNFFMQNNVYTANTGTPLKIRSVRGLETAGAGNTNRMIAYRKDPEVLKMHIPMPLRFMPVQIVDVEFRVPGMFRLGGLDVRLPKEMRYMDGF